jgi:hypothetical protein
MAFANLFRETAAREPDTFVCFGFMCKCKLSHGEAANARWMRNICMSHEYED